MLSPYTDGSGGVRDDDYLKIIHVLYASVNPNRVKSFDKTNSVIYLFHELPTLIEQFD